MDLAHDLAHKAASRTSHSRSILTTVAAAIVMMVMMVPMPKLPTGIFGLYLGNIRVKLGLGSVSILPLPSRKLLERNHMIPKCPKPTSYY